MAGGIASESVIRGWGHRGSKTSHSSVSTEPGDGYMIILYSLHSAFVSVWHFP